MIYRYLLGDLRRRFKRRLTQERMLTVTVASATYEQRKHSEMSNELLSRTEALYSSRRGHTHSLGQTAPCAHVSQLSASQCCCITASSIYPPSVCVCVVKEAAAFNLHSDHHHEHPSTAHPATVNVFTWRHVPGFVFVYTFLAR